MRKVAALLAFLLALASGLSPIHAGEQSGAMWVYETDEIVRSPAASAELLTFCREHHLDDLYWATHYLRDRADPPVARIPDSPELRAFLHSATAAHLRIHALSGDPADIQPPNHGKVLARIEATVRFNEAGAADERFAGVHLDIEPHAQAVWRTSSEAERCAMLTDFVSVHAKAARLLHQRAPEMIYGADVVFWLGKKNRDGSPVYPVTLEGRTADPELHLLRIVDQLALMSYRSFAEGKNGVIELVRNTIERAGETKCRVFVGLKMAPIGPSLETFHGRSESDLQQAAAEIQSAFGQSPRYGGIAYFMYSAWRDMPR